MTDGDARGLQVVLVNAVGRPIRARGLADWLRRVAPARARGLLTIAVVSDDTMRRMNRRYLGKNRPTDVLSFPSAMPVHPPQAGARWTASTSVGQGFSPARQRVLGDIAIASGVARRQARAAGHPYARELRVLALHGLLHLLGYDHERDAGQMARLEARMRRRGGLVTGLIERVGQA
jgi:probable rRNA maturation factor